METRRHSATWATACRRRGGIPGTSRRGGGRSGQAERTRTSDGARCQQHQAGRQRQVAGLAEDHGIEQLDEQAPGVPPERVVKDPAPAPHELTERRVHPAGDDSADQRDADRQAEGLDPLARSRCPRRTGPGRLRGRRRRRRPSARSRCTGRWRTPAAIGRHVTACSGNDCISVIAASGCTTRSQNVSQRSSGSRLTRAAP